MFAVVVEFTLKHGSWDDFMPLMYENAATSLREEPGCHQFDVATNPEKPQEVFLYELYTDALAFETHKNMPHFMSFDALSAGYVADKKVMTFAKVVQ